MGTPRMKNFLCSNNYRNTNYQINVCEDAGCLHYVLLSLFTCEN